MVKKVVVEAGRRELFDDKAKKCEPCRGTRRIRVGESAFMLPR
jgi:hypothetical protein